MSKDATQALREFAAQRDGALIETEHEKVSWIQRAGIGCGTTKDGKVIPVLCINDIKFSMCCKRCAAKMLVQWADAIQAMGDDLE